MSQSDDLEALFELETFDAGGRSLWDGMRDARDAADVESLVVEACRVKDRLDRLHLMVSRDDSEWARVILPEGKDEYVLQMSDLLREQRQTEVVFKQLLAEVARRRLDYGDDELDEEGGLSGL
ncbi:hypothetical protein ACTXJY_00265 [Corynebacterium casei]|uniref:hypothetical protein n=1 Tax=Corynebacterium casei TaxID=160386 RepID=UPI003FD10831